MPTHNIQKQFAWAGWTQLASNQSVRMGDVVCDDGIAPWHAFSANNGAPQVLLRFFNGKSGQAWVVSGLQGATAHRATESHGANASVWRRVHPLSLEETLAIGTAGLQEEFAIVMDHGMPTGGWWHKPTSRVKMNKLYAKAHPFFSRDQDGCTKSAIEAEPF